jgi:predicted ribosome quality control (RQC) complex YloA/Tae2 family protein
MEIKLILNKDVNYNANLYFEKAKKLKSKIQGIDNIIKKTKEEIDSLKSKKENLEKFEKKKELINSLKSKNWYDKFRWTKLKSGNLLIMGKDSTTNEILIKKHLEKTDIVLHSSAPGSPFGLVKNGYDENGNLLISKSEIEEAMSFVLSFSKQWKLGFGVADGFYVKHDQISKTAESGEYMNKGSFMIRGEKNVLKNIPLRVGFGLIKKKVELENEKITYFEQFSGPLSSVEKYCDKYVILEPGNFKYKALNKQLKKLFKVSILEDLPKYIPNECKIVKKKV